MMMFVHLFDNLSRAFNLHQSGLDLQVVIKESSRVLQGVFKRSSSILRAKNLESVIQSEPKILRLVCSDTRESSRRERTIQM